MHTTQPHRSLEELARLSSEIFSRHVRPMLGAEDEGKFVAIDLQTSDYEIDDDDYEAVARLRSRRPSAEVWLERVGHRTTYLMRCSFQPSATRRLLVCGC